MDFVLAVAVFIPRKFPLSMIHRLVEITPFLQP
jgi:hypothetical protein